VLSARRRDALVARPRLVAYYLCREMTPASLPEIGRHFGNRDHSTIKHGVETIAAAIAADPAFAAEVDAMRAQAARAAA
jgi:chromosomal replication initiator protein